MTQCETILRHMEKCGSISSLEAMQEYGIMRLASRITDLKRAGVPIKREMVTQKNRYGEPVTFARYSIAAMKSDNVLLEQMPIYEKIGGA